MSALTLIIEEAQTPTISLPGLGLPLMHYGKAYAQCVHFNVH